MVEASHKAAHKAADFIPVEDAAALEELFTRSRVAPVVLFKHSTTCPISAHAYREMAQLDPSVAGEVALVVVQTARSVSNEVTKRTGIRHESPQAFVLRDGKVVWSASHFDVRADEVVRAVRENQ